MPNLCSTADFPVFAMEFNFIRGLQYYDFIHAQHRSNVVSFSPLSSFFFRNGMSFSVIRYYLTKPKAIR